MKNNNKKVLQKTNNSRPSKMLRLTKKEIKEVAEQALADCYYFDNLF